MRVPCLLRKFFMVDRVVESSPKSKLGILKSIHIRTASFEETFQKKERKLMALNFDFTYIYHRLTR